MVEAVYPFNLQPTSMLYISKVFDQLLLWWMGIWMHTHTINATYVAPDLGELNEVQGKYVHKWCHYTMFEAAYPFRLHSSSMLYIQKVFEHLLLWWVGMWIYTVIGHGIGGKHIPAEMAWLTESQPLEYATTVCRHLILSPLKTNDGSKIQVRRRHILYGIPT